MEQINSVETQHKIEVLGSSFMKMLAIASTTRHRFMLASGNDFTKLDMKCREMSQALVEAYHRAGYMNAVVVGGTYLGASEDYVPDMSDWSEEAVDNFNVENGYSHFWVELAGLNFDICLDQFHPSERAKYGVVIEPNTSSSYMKDM